MVKEDRRVHIIELSYSMVTIMCIRRMCSTREPKFTLINVVGLLNDIVDPRYGRTRWIRKGNTLTPKSVIESEMSEAKSRDQKVYHESRLS